MEIKSDLPNLLFSNVIWSVLDYLLQELDQPLTDTEIVSHISNIKKSSVNLALRKLASVELITRTPRGKMIFNALSDSPLIPYLKIVSNQVHLQPVIDGLIPYCYKILLFGSRSDGTNSAISDYDLFIVTNHTNTVVKLIQQSKLAEKIQPVIKSLDQLLTLSRDNIVFYNQIKKGIVLWEKM